MGVVSTSSFFLVSLTLQGYPEDLIVAVALGADMFDCVWPTRTAVSRLHIYLDSTTDDAAFWKRRD